MDITWLSVSQILVITHHDFAIYMSQLCYYLLTFLKINHLKNHKFILFFDFFDQKCGTLLKTLLNLLQYCFCFMFWFLATRHVGS